MRLLAAAAPHLQSPALAPALPSLGMAGVCGVRPAEPAATPPVPGAWRQGDTARQALLRARRSLGWSIAAPVAGAALLQRVLRPAGT
ncbi:hypothetical protein XaCFBP7622_05980 [Xanthomonas arboricola]|nr:hypothetical protein XaCFBP7622_05980 [Xanthomonas arboricola]